eukprot:1690277-Prymnesium_polylepis.1
MPPCEPMVWMAWRKKRKLAVRDICGMPVEDVNFVGVLSCDGAVERECVCVSRQCAHSSPVHSEVAFGGGLPPPNPSWPVMS